jgi:hypothetical protein
MATHGSEMVSAGNKGLMMVFRSMFIVFTMALLCPMAALSSSDRLVDSNDYKDKDFHKGCITDYSDMVKGDDIDWVWTSPGKQLAQYRLKVGNVENKSDMRSKSLMETTKTTFKDAFTDMDVKGETGTLTADLCIYEVQDYNPGKAWIPFVGGRQMQAGIGIEVILRDGNNKTIAKIRNFSRRGMQPEAALEESAGEFVKYIRKH